MLLTSTLGQFQEPSLHQPPGCWPATVTSDPSFEEMRFPQGCYVTFTQIQSNTLPWAQNIPNREKTFSIGSLPGAVCEALLTCFKISPMRSMVNLKVT